MCELCRFMLFRVCRHQILLQSIVNRVLYVLHMRGIICLKTQIILRLGFCLGRFLEHMLINYFLSQHWLSFDLSFHDYQLFHVACCVSWLVQVLLFGSLAIICTVLLCRRLLMFAWPRKNMFTRAMIKFISLLQY